MEIQAPTDSQTVLQLLPAYYTYLQSGGFSKYTPDDFTGDMKKFGVFTKDKPGKNPTIRGNVPRQMIESPVLTIKPQIFLLPFLNLFL